MNSVLHQNLEKLEISDIARTLTSILHGIEKEGLRVTPGGSLSERKHPEKLGSPLTNASITTDFSEALLELITPVFSEVDESLDYLKNVHQFTYSHLGEEILWAGSMPCHIGTPDTIPLADFGSSNMGRMKRLYRVGLKNRYGSMMQSIAGIHYNFSLPEGFWLSFKSYKQNLDSLQKFKSSSYFTLIRNFRRHSWLLLYLFGASPALDKSFIKGKGHNLQKLHENSLYLPFATSLRMSDIGYSTSAQSSLKICFNHLETFIKTLIDAIHTPYPDYQRIGVKVDGEYRQLSSTVLQIENEYYSDIRPKRVSYEDETALQALIRGGVEYIEVRNTDLNPFLPLGIDEQQAYFLDVFLLSCLLMDESLMTDQECKNGAENLQRVCTKGREPGLQIICPHGEIEIGVAGNCLLDDLQLTAGLLDRLHKTSRYSDAVTSQQAKIDNPELTPSAQVVHELKSLDCEYHDWVLNKSLEHSKNLKTFKTNKKIQLKLEQMTKASFEELQKIEAADTISFDEYLLTARTGTKEDYLP